MSQDNDLTAYLADRPKMTGALFTLTLLAPGTLVSAAGAGYPGP